MSAHGRDRTLIIVQEGTKVLADYGGHIFISLKNPSASLISTPQRIAYVRSHSAITAPHKLEPLKLASLKLLDVESASVRSVSIKLAPFRLELRRFALVTADFLAYDFIANDELPHLLEAAERAAEQLSSVK